MPDTILMSEQFVVSSIALLALECSQIGRVLTVSILTGEFVTKIKWTFSTRVCHFSTLFRNSSVSRTFQAFPG